MSVSTTSAVQLSEFLKKITKKIENPRNSEKLNKYERLLAGVIQDLNNPENADFLTAKPEIVALYQKAQAALAEQKPATFKLVGSPPSSPSSASQTDEAAAEAAEEQPSFLGAVANFLGALAGPSPADFETPADLGTLDASVEEQPTDAASEASTAEQEPASPTASQLFDDAAAGRIELEEKEELASTTASSQVSTAEKEPASPTASSQAGEETDDVAEEAPVGKKSCFGLCGTKAKNIEEEEEVLVASQATEEEPTDAVAASPTASSEVSTAEQEEEPGVTVPDSPSPAAQAFQTEKNEDVTFQSEDETSEAPAEPTTKSLWSRLSCCSRNKAADVEVDAEEEEVAASDDEIEPTQLTAEEDNTQVSDDEEDLPSVPQFSAASNLTGTSGDAEPTTTTALPEEEAEVEESSNTCREVSVTVVLTTAGAGVGYVTLGALGAAIGSVTTPVLIAAGAYLIQRK